ncbi:PAS domain S-box-containing protein [Caloramator quimbayensis]|uniref:PAS domain S-box-containing protein n=1 Tax=Caloramator quimbayensis TaxID=1147123 RepID=A0A1T4XU52_9CLOT|nr:sigma-54 dependent transcriptional regulator PrdR [Caloramator quimbayensis]SKA92615.1 PAS domain S-box-containing protein [Caloramator quimbayensis]
MIADLFFKVKDIMTVDFLKALPTESINSVMNKMIRAFKDEVIVMDENEHIVGLFTKYDLSKIKKLDVSFDEPIEKYIIKDVLVIGPDFSVKDARDLMIKKNIGRLPIVENGKVIGILTANNIRDTFYIKMNELFDFQNNIIDNIHEAICISDSKGNVIYWNKSAENLYNIKSEEIIGKDIADFFPNAMTLKVLKEKKPIENMQHEPVKGKSVILSAIPIFNSSNELIAVVTTDRDITEVVNLSKQLESEKEKVEFLEDAYKKEISKKYSFSNIYGKNKKIIDAIALAQRVSHTSASILITGESGTGKEVFAKAIHEASGRTGNFVAVNCSAIPEQLLESELFGYVEGAFTGAAKKGKMGKFELANNGTLFLDEIGDMPFEMQAKLLRVLQDGIIYRLGSEKGIPTNTRIIAATNKDLKKMMKENKFRDDLFYRLAVVQIELPPLRERKEDIKDLINLFINQMADEEDIKINSIDNSVYDVLENYNWEGNIRELKNVIQRMVILCNNGNITINCIPEYILNVGIQKVEVEENEYDLQKIVEKVEKETIIKILKLTNGNKQKAAKMLNIKRTTLYYKLNQYNLS